MAVLFTFTRTSSNAKTGPVPVTMTSANSCPDACKLKGQGCYAGLGMVGIHWNRLSRAAEGFAWEGKGQPPGITLDALLGAIRALPAGTLWRHNVAGDLPSDSQGRIDSATIEALSKANEGRKGFTYTHNIVTGDTPTALENRRLIRKANDYGFTVNLSADNPAQADTLAALGVGPVVTLLDTWEEGQPKTLETPQGKPIVVCPAVTTEGIQCANCGLCANPGRKSIVGFPVHGAGRNKARKVFMMAS